MGSRSLQSNAGTEDSEDQAKLVGDLRHVSSCICIINKLSFKRQRCWSNQQTQGIQHTSLILHPHKNERIRIDFSSSLVLKPSGSVRSSMLARKVSSVFQVFCSLLGHLNSLGDAEEACGMVTAWSTWVLQVRCALVQLLAMFDSLSKSTKLQLEVLSEGDMTHTRETLKSSLQIAKSNLSKLSDFRCQVTAKSCECEKLMNLFSNNDNCLVVSSCFPLLSLFSFFHSMCRWSDRITYLSVRNSQRFSNFSRIR